MKKRLLYFILCFCFFALPVHAGFFDSFFDKFSGNDTSSDQLSEDTIISALKEALVLSTKKAVSKVSRERGYFNNPEIKIPIPEKLQTVTDVLKKFGFEETINQFELSMNRAVEKAAPQATSLFTDAISRMSVEDAESILNGGQTAATEYFSSQTSEKLYNLFKPAVSKSMDQVEVTKHYKAIENKYTALVPLGGINHSLELDHYVTQKGIDGLFYMMAEEEKKIRNNPVERTTELLRTVFGR